MDIKESGEMYLETIYILKKQKPTVHSVDIVEMLNYSKSSVSKGVNILKDLAYITVDSSGAINFTEKGRNRAEEIYERHKVITSFLVKIGVDEQVAEDDACKIEHHISRETFLALKKQLDK